MPKYILCFGDSNTKGTDPVTGERFDFDVRWPGVLQRTLGIGWHIYEDGLGGRTTVFEDPIEPGRSGRALLPGILKVTAPLDLVIVMLGTNDCKNRFDMPAWDIGFGLEALIGLMQNPAYGRGGKPPRVLAVSPAPLAGERLKKGRFRDMFSDGAIAKSALLADAFQDAARRKGAFFLDAAGYVGAGADGLHLDRDAHAVLGAAFAEKVRDILD